MQATFPLAGGRIMTVADDGLYVWDRDHAGTWQPQQLTRPDESKAFAFVNTCIPLSDGSIAMIRETVEGEDARTVLVWRHSASGWLSKQVRLAPGFVPSGLHSIGEGRFGAFHAAFMDSPAARTGAAREEDGDGAAKDDL